MEDSNFTTINKIVSWDCKLKHSGTSMASHEDIISIITTEVAKTMLH